MGVVCRRMTYQSNPTHARTTARIRKAIKIQTPVDLKKDSLSSSFLRHSKRPQLLRQQVTLLYMSVRGTRSTSVTSWRGIEDDMKSGRREEDTTRDPS